MTLPVVPRPIVQPIDWRDLPRTYLNHGELEIIVALVWSASVIVEIGLAQGRTAKAILRTLPQVQQYIGIDTGPRYRTKLVGQWGERGEDPGHLAMDDPRFNRWLLPRGSLDLHPADFPMVVDAMFIDGDHSSEAVRHDSDLARSVVAAGGLIIWHDYRNDGVEVTRVLEEDYRRGHQIRHIENTWLAFERR